MIVQSGDEGVGTLISLGSRPIKSFLTMLQKTGIKLLLNVHFSLQAAWLMQSNSARSSCGLFSPSSPAWAAAARCWNASVLLVCRLGSEWGLRASTPSVLQVFWQASWPIWAQVHAYLHGLGWMGVQLWRTEWLPNPIKTQAFTRVPEGPRQVTPKLSCSLYWHSSSCPWGTHPGGLTRCHNPPLPLLSSTADCTRGVQHFDHKTPTTSGLFLFH